MTTPQISRGPTRVFWILLSISVALILLSLYSWFNLAIAAPLIMRDLPVAQRDRAASMLRTMASSYVVVLGILNVLWIAGARYLLHCVRMNEEQRR